MNERTKRIRELNAEFRRAPTGRGRLMLTSGIVEMGVLFMMEAQHKMRHFEAFDGGNDPHGEHDFGAFEVQEAKCFFKIDYYDKKLEYGSEDPSDPTKTTRVITLMLAEEY